MNHLTPFALTPFAPFADIAPLTANQCLQHLPLLRAEAVLLIHHHQRCCGQFLEIEECVGTDDEVGVTIPLVGVPLHYKSRTHRLGQVFLRLFVQLKRQQRRGSHQDTPMGQRHHRRCENHHRLARSDIPHDDPLRRPVTPRQILSDRCDHLLLLRR